MDVQPAMFGQIKHLRVEPLCCVITLRDCLHMKQQFEKSCSFILKYIKEYPPLLLDFYYDKQFALPRPYELRKSLVYFVLCLFQSSCVMKIKLQPLLCPLLPQLYHLLLLLQHLLKRKSQRLDPIQLIIPMVLVLWLLWACS